MMLSTVIRRLLNLPLIGYYKINIFYFRYTLIFAYNQKIFHKKAPMH